MDCASFPFGHSRPSSILNKYSATQLAIAWILRQPNVASALVGASRPEQLQETIKASGVKLSSETLEKINEILAN